MTASSGLFSVIIYNQSQLEERKHVARYWSINTAATAVPLSAHPSPLVITRKLAVAIFGGPLFGGGALLAQYYPCVCSTYRKLTVDHTYHQFTFVKSHSHSRRHATVEILREDLSCVVGDAQLSQCISTSCLVVVH